MAEYTVKTEVRDLITTSLDFIKKAKNWETNLEHAKLECTSRLRRALQLISGEGDGARYEDLRARVSAMLAAVPDLRAEVPTTSFFWAEETTLILTFCLQP